MREDGKNKRCWHLLKIIQIANTRNQTWMAGCLEIKQIFSGQFSNDCNAKLKCRYMVCQNWRNWIHQTFVYAIKHSMLYLIPFNPYLIAFIVDLSNYNTLSLYSSGLNWGPLADCIFVFCQPSFCKWCKSNINSKIVKAVGLLQNLHSDIFINPVNSGPSATCRSYGYDNGAAAVRK